MRRSVSGLEQDRLIRVWRSICVHVHCSRARGARASKGPRSARLAEGWRGCGTNKAGQGLSRMARVSRRPRERASAWVYPDALDAHADALHAAALTACSTRAAACDQVPAAHSSLRRAVDRAPCWRGARDAAPCKPRHGELRDCRAATGQYVWLRANLSRAHGEAMPSLACIEVRPP